MSSERTPFQLAQRRRQARWRGDRPPGQWRLDDGRVLDLAWALPVDRAVESLYPPVAGQLLERFHRDGIDWHDQEQDRYGPRSVPGPSPNLMDSQSFCLSFWVGLAHDAGPDGLLAALQVLLPQACAVEPPLHDLVEPEWIGLDNPLGERGRARRRGRYATSADLLLAWRDAPGRRHGLLIESKWSESYDGLDLRYSSRGTDRAAIYAPAWTTPWSPIRPQVPPEQLMVDPFDQLLRLQLLAAAMEQRRELDLQTVTVAWVAPRANSTLWSRITAPVLAGQGATVPDAWRSVLRQPDRFCSAATEDVFDAARTAPGAQAWARWMADRYGLDGRP